MTRERKHKPKCKLCAPIPLGYGESFEDSERRDRAGQVQTECPGCGLWRWPEELRLPPDPHRAGDTE